MLHLGPSYSTPCAGMFSPALFPFSAPHLALLGVQTGVCTFVYCQHLFLLCRVGVNFLPNLEKGNHNLFILTPCA